MVLLVISKESDNRAKVVGKHYNIDELPQDYIESNIMLNSEPFELPRVEGKITHMYINPVNKETWFEYEDRPLTKDETEIRIQDLEMAIGAILGGAM